MSRKVALILGIIALTLPAVPLFAGNQAEDLLAAAGKGDVATVKALLAKGVDVNAKTAYGATALSFAADKGHVDIVKLLLDHKADVNVRDTFYKSTPLGWAISRNHKEIVALLVDAGAEDASDALSYAAQRGNVALAQAVLKKTEVSKATLDKALAAAPKSKTEIIDLLTEAGAKAAEPKASVKVDSAILKTYVGTYRNEDLAQELKVVLQKDRLLVKSGSAALYLLQAVDESHFQPQGSDSVTVSFVRDNDKVASLVRKSGATETIFKRIEPRAGPEAIKEDDKPAVVKTPMNWPSFRGLHASGVADGQFPPTTWDAANGHNIAWKTPIPGLGLSCPVVWGNSIFLTTAVSSGDKAGLKTGLYGDVESVKDSSPHTFEVMCLDKASGKILWERVAHQGVPKVKRHTKATHANSTCATDGKHVVACFGSEGLYCYDFAGKLLWKQDLGVLESGWFYDADRQWGFGSSPIIYKNMAIVQCDADKNSFIAAYDLADGKRIWSTARDEISSWGTPTIVETKNGVELVTNGTKFVRGYDPNTGEELWRLGRNSEITVPTPIYANELIYVTSGYRAPKPIYAIRAGARGDITPAKNEKTSDALAWSNQGGTYMPTPLVYDGHFYICSTDGIVTCYDALTGKRIWWERLGSDAGFTASPVAADGRLYFTSEDGETYVLKAGPEFTLLATNTLGDPCLATPAISDGMMLVRTQRYLFGVARGAGRK